MDFEIKIGADPEVFVKRGGKVVPAWGIIPGDKAEPHPVNKGAIQVDGLATEFNIDPAATADEFSTNVGLVMEQLLERLKKDDPSSEFATESYATFSREEYEALPEKAREIGCVPDFNAYTERENRIGSASRTRFVGGHVHFSWTKDQDPKSYEHINACIMLTKMFDLFIGIPTLFLDPYSPRRNYYGKAGNFRPKSYGVEYRTPSNFWIFKPTLRKWVFNRAMKAFTTLVEDNKELYADRAYRDIMPANWWGANYDPQASINLKKALKKWPLLAEGLNLTLSELELEYQETYDKYRRDGYSTAVYNKLNALRPAAMRAALDAENVIVNEAEDMGDVEDNEDDDWPNDARDDDI